MFTEEQVFAKIGFLTMLVEHQQKQVQALSQALAAKEEKEGEENEPSDS